MPVVGEKAFVFTASHRGSGYSTGTTWTRDHMVIPVRGAGFFSIHTGLSHVQATTDGPFGASIGVMRFGNTDFGPDPANWPPLISGNVGFWTIAWQVNKGDMTGWEFFQIFS